MVDLSVFKLIYGVGLFEFNNSDKVTPQHSEDLVIPKFIRILEC